MKVDSTLLLSIQARKHSDRPRSRHTHVDTNSNTKPLRHLSRCDSRPNDRISSLRCTARAQYPLLSGVLSRAEPHCELLWRSKPCQVGEREFSINAQSSVPGNSSSQCRQSREKHLDFRSVKKHPVQGAGQNAAGCGARGYRRHRLSNFSRATGRQSVPQRPAACKIMPTLFPRSISGKL